MTTHKIDPALVREVALPEKYHDAKIIIHPDSIEITSPDEDCEWDVYEDLAADLDYCGYFEGSCFIDIHRFKDMAIDYFGNKGWPITIYISNRPEDNSWGQIRVNDGAFVPTFGNGKRDYPNRLSAELAAIDFCWKQIQEEKTNER